MALFSLSGRQYFVSGKEKFTTLKLDKKEGEVFEVEDDLTGKKIKLKVISQTRGEKVRVLKFKCKTGYKRVYGSRPYLSEIEVLG